MHLVQRLYRDALLPEEINRRALTAILPAMRTVPGFLGYTMVDFRSGRLGSYTMFASRAEADRMAPSVPGVVRGVLGDLLPLAPQIRAGEVLLHHRDRAQAGTMAVRHYAGCTDAAELARRIGALILPRFIAMAGFHGYALVDEGAGRVTSFSLFGTRADLDTANVLVAPLVREHLSDLLDSAPESMVGRVLSETLA